VREEFALPTLYVFPRRHRDSRRSAARSWFSTLGKVRAHGRPDDVFTDPSIFPMTRTEGFENVLHGKVHEAFELSRSLEIGPRQDVLRPSDPMAGEGSPRIRSSAHHGKGRYRL